MVKYKMNIFKFVSVVFGFVRQFMLPNPFEVLENGITINGIILTPYALNWIAGIFVPCFTRIMVGFVYESGSCPVFGSFLFMIVYVFNFGILELMSRAYPNIWLIHAIAISYAIICFFVAFFVNKLKNNEYYID